VKDGSTSHPFILAVNAARMINSQCGGAVIAPWEVNQLSADELDVFYGLSKDLPARQAVEKKKEQVFEDVRKRHPNYRKY